MLWLIFNIVLFLANTLAAISYTIEFGSPKAIAFSWFASGMLFISILVQLSRFL